MKIFIVLGNRNPIIMKKRVDRAIEEFNKNPSEITTEEEMHPTMTQQLFFTGGSSDGISKPEGAVMMEEYTVNKVDKKFCFVEKESKTTIENLIFTKKILDESYGLTEDYKPELVICTSSFHIKRTIILSYLIFKGYTNISFIHTDEKITKQEREREEKTLLRSLDDFCSNVI
jgi:hypothetical protein